MKLQTKRLILRDFELIDAESLARNINNPIISYMTGNLPYPYTLEKAKKYMVDDSVESKKDPRLEYRLAIQFKENPDVIGSIGLHRLDLKNKKATVAYWLGVDYHRQGIMSEAEEEILRFAFEDLKLHKIVGTALVVNDASNKLFERFNFRKVGTYLKDRYKDGVWIVVNQWELLEGDYKK